LSLPTLQVRVEVAATLAALATGTATALYLATPLAVPRASVDRSSFVVRDAGVVPGADAAPADDGTLSREGPAADLPQDLVRPAPARTREVFERQHPHHAAPLDAIPAAVAQVPAAPPPPAVLTIPRLHVRSRVLGVGIARTGQLQLPPDGRTVVWYRYGAVPGEDGSAVLAAHVDYNRRAGPFYRLRLLSPGDRVAVTLANGSTRRFVVAARRLYAKPALPANLVFRRDGGPVLALITCGGRFDYKTRKYGDNVVIYAVPA
jgi:sortase family protein